MKYCLLFLSAVVFLVSCEKTEAPKSKQDKLRDGKWWLDTTVIAYYKPYSDTDSVYGIGNASVPDCKKDDRIVFREATAGAHLTNKERCGAELDEYGFTWSIFENDTKMYLYGVGSFMGQDNINANLIDFADDRFVIEYFTYYYRENPGSELARDTTKHTATFIKK